MKFAVKLQRKADVESISFALPMCMKLPCTQFIP